MNKDTNLNTSKNTKEKPPVIKIVIIVSLILAVGAFLFFGLLREKGEIQSPLIGKAVPEFSYPSLFDQTINVSSSDFDNQVYLLNVWASWCTTCFIEHPVLVEISKNYDVTLIGINYKDTEQDAKVYLEKYDDPFDRIIYDPQGTLGLDLGVYATPESFLVDKQGIIRFKHIGNITPTLWTEKLAPLVSELESESANLQIK